MDQSDSRNSSSRNIVAGRAVGVDFALDVVIRGFIHIKFLSTKQAVS